jgi:CHAD domain-containing protein
MKPAPNASQFAQQLLPRLAERFFARGRRAARPDATAGDLHCFRLAAKHFRYTLELFRPVYGPGLDRRMAAVRRIQQILGEANDCATARDLVLAGGEKTSRIARNVTAFIDHRAALLAAQFRDFWAATFDRPGEQQRWTEYLTRYAGRVRRS